MYLEREKREALLGFSHVYCPDGYNNTCSLKAASLKRGFTMGRVGGTFQGQRKRFGAFDCLGPAHGSPGGHILLMTSSNIAFQLFLLPYRCEATEVKEAKSLYEESVNRFGSLCS